MRFGYLPDHFETKAVISRDAIQEVSLDSSCVDFYKNYPCKEDPRLLVTPTNSAMLTVTYSTIVGVGLIKQNLLQGSVDVSANTVKFTHNYLLDYHGQSQKQKNWVPFIHNDKVLLVQSIRPYHVVEPIGGVSNNKSNLSRSLQNVQFLGRVNMGILLVEVLLLYLSTGYTSPYSTPWPCFKDFIACAHISWVQ